MTTWVLSPRTVRCGYCGTSVLKGEPVLELRLKGTRMRDGHAIGAIDVKRVLYRCQRLECAGEPVPDLATVVAPEPMRLPPLARLSADTLPKDFKALQAGEREVGEEG